MEAILVTLIVVSSLLCIAGAFALAVLATHLEKKRQPPAELPEWLQGLTDVQLRALLQAKRHKTQPELHAMAIDMRALNVAQQRSSLVAPASVEFNTGELEVRHAH